MYVHMSKPHVRGRVLIYNTLLSIDDTVELDEDDLVAYLKKHTVFRVKKIIIDGSGIHYLIVMDTCKAIAFMIDNDDVYLNNDKIYCVRKLNRY